MPNGICKLKCAVFEIASFRAIVHAFATWDLFGIWSLRFGACGRSRGDRFLRRIREIVCRD
jgi:hypothetical protein